MTASSVRLAELCWPEVRARLEAGWTTVILPLGSTEQHGPLLPLSVDSEIAGRLAEAVARRLGRCLVAPVVVLGCSAHRLGFPGSMSVSPDTLARLVAESCESLGRHGFRRVLVISGHAGNVPAARMALLREQVGARLHRLNRGCTLPGITMPAAMQAAAASSHVWISCPNTSARESCWPSFFVRPDGVITGRLRSNCFQECDRNEF